MGIPITNKTFKGQLLPMGQVELVRIMDHQGADATFGIGLRAARGKAELFRIMPRQGEPVCLDPIIMGIH